MKPTKKEATPAPEAEALDTAPAPEPEAPVATDESALQTDVTVEEDAAATSDQTSAEDDAQEGDGGGEAPQPETIEETPIEADAATSGPWNKMLLGHVECRSAFMPLHDVLDCLPQSGRDRIDILTGEPSIRSQANRMLGTDGRCTPVVFSGDARLEHMLDGYETLAAAHVAGVADIPVILVAPSDVGMVQSLLAQRRPQSASQSSDDDLFWRVNGLAVD